MLPPGGAREVPIAAHHGGHGGSDSWREHLHPRPPIGDVDAPDRQPMMSLPVPCGSCPGAMCPSRGPLRRPRGRQAVWAGLVLIHRELAIVWLLNAGGKKHHAAQGLLHDRVDAPPDS